MDWIAEKFMVEKIAGIFSRAGKKNVFLNFRKTIRSLYLIGIYRKGYMEKEIKCNFWTHQKICMLFLLNDLKKIEGLGLRLTLHLILCSGFKG